MSDIHEPSVFQCACWIKILVPVRQHSTAGISTSTPDCVRSLFMVDVLAMEIDFYPDWSVNRLVTDYWSRVLLVRNITQNYLVFFAFSAKIRKPYLIPQICFNVWSLVQKT